MDRARLALLATCALLSTTIEPFDGKPPVEAPATLEFVEAEVHSASESKTEEKLVAQILTRLSIRHTALPERERIALARTILREARAQDLDPVLVVAVIEVESAGYHLAVSHVGAMGLMQILPATGKELADRMNIEWKGPDTLFDPTINVKLGTAYLRQLTDRFGCVHTALAAYNWGPGRIERRLRRGAAVPSHYIDQVLRAVDRHTLAMVSRS